MLTFHRYRAQDDELVLTREETERTKPSVDDFFADSAKACEDAGWESVFVFICGPDALGQSVRKALAKRTNSKTKYHVHTEIFRLLPGHVQFTKSLFGEGD